MDRFKWLLICLLFAVYCFAPELVQAQDGNGEIYIFESLNDSTDLSNDFYDVYDSNSLYLPASAIYENWNNEYIHYPQVDFTKKEDTTLLILVDANSGSFSLPRKAGINSEYGWRKRRFHYGIDIDLNIGDSVKSAFDGVVRISKYHKGYGNIIVIRHFNGLETFYGHLSLSRVFENQSVKAGEFIGYGGSTGRSTGPHLHFETRYMGTPFNPRKIINFEKGCLQSDTLLICKYTFNNTPVAKTTNITTAQNNVVKTGTQTHNTSGATYYTIKKGETLSYVATIYHTTVDRLCQLNGISSRSIIQIGQKIRVK